MLKAAEKNNDVAQYNLGYSIYEAGSEESLYWLNRAAENNNLQAIMYLASYYHNQDIKKAIYYYQKGAELNDSQAMLELSYLYENGEGVEKDDKKAVELLEEAFRLQNL